MDNRADRHSTPPPRHYDGGVGRHKAKVTRRYRRPQEPKGAATRRLLRQVHRWTGLFAALFLAALAITGLLINHAPDLGLDRAEVRSGWLRDYYGLPGYRVGDSAVGSVDASGLRIVARTDQLVLLTPDGQLVEHLSGAELPGRIERIGTVDGRVVIATDTGLHQADENLLAWSPDVERPEAVRWSTASSLPAAAVDALRGEAQPELTWERVLLDLHGGRLFGLTGRIIADLTAIAILYLLISGLITWRRNGRLRR